MAGCTKLINRSESRAPAPSRAMHDGNRFQVGPIFFERLLCCAHTHTYGFKGFTCLNRIKIEQTTRKRQNLEVHNKWNDRCNKPAHTNHKGSAHFTLNDQFKTVLKSPNRPPLSVRRDRYRFTITPPIGGTHWWTRTKKTGRVGEIEKECKLASRHHFG